ncbi:MULTISPECIES: WYL domain-containing protein [Psychrilyobacter]|uniref:WYL domain-containing protein n=1 Tax=Psychrilyobacter piezotolerans TaxID=2293438 RepID=A0ABX9KF07_9FUSO|nr:MULTISPECIES: WYL domain-containing protein [Psychrilyobacter]MCS5422746.1 WYL domain-containing protein [Psychrilyobacter sp. S5]NDI78705.1 WYL domain-containing protein [Psychrilyobacter piezotolerans]RDE59880.1 WYL domain-containing protein [Psychrilyobacter sp. S5]REI40161.1 WYL domain-containing protein [Psychrilyobacter piezotolerans]
MKKIRVTIPKYMGDILKYDAVEFGLSKNYLLNYLVKNYSLLREKDIPVLEGEKEIVQFNLNKENEDFYREVYNRSEFETEASFIRTLIYGYISQSKVIRERFIFKKLIGKIQRGIKDKKKIKIKFETAEKIVSPYNILYSSMEVSNYLFCYSEEDQNYKNYRLCNIKYVYILDENSYTGDTEYLRKVREDFDPFLSYGLPVEIRLSERGQEKYDRIKTNRPKLIEKLDDRWIVEGSQEKIKRYFAYFMSDAEIISPMNLREWFFEEAKKMIEMYG